MLALDYETGADPDQPPAIGAPNGTRTRSQRLKRPLLYQLSFGGDDVGLREGTILLHPVRAGDVSVRPGPSDARTPPGFLVIRQGMGLGKGRRRRMERVRGIEPPWSAWEAGILPLNYTRMDWSGL